MATAEKQQKVATVGELKEFLNQISDDIPICGVFDEKIEAIIWKADKGEAGHREWFSMEEI